MSELFEKIHITDARKKSSYVVEQVLGAIQAGRLSVGDKLPSERTMAQSMNVSRNSVREALSVLQIYGLVVSRAGDGTYITKANDHLLNLETEMVAVLEENDNLFDAIEERVILESGAAKLAARNASGADHGRMRSSLERMRDAVGGDEEDLDGYFEANQRFHLAIASASGNALIERHLEALLKVMAKRLWQTIRRDYLFGVKRAEETLPVHQAIYQAIIARDEAKAESSMKRHFEGLEEPFPGRGKP